MSEKLKIKTVLDEVRVERAARLLANSAIGNLGADTEAATVFLKRQPHHGTITPRSFLYRAGTRAAVILRHRYGAENLIFNPLASEQASTERYQLGGYGNYATGLSPRFLAVVFNQVNVNLSRQAEDAEVIAFPSVAEPDKLAA